MLRLCASSSICRQLVHATARFFAFYDPFARILQSHLLCSAFRPLAPPLMFRFCPLVRLQRRLRVTLRSKICLFVPLRSYRQLLLYSHNDNFYLATTWSVLRFEPLSRQTLTIVNQTLGDKHLHTLSFCNNLAVVLRETGASFQKPKWC